MVFFFKKFMTIILDFILPRRCLMCGDFTQQDDVTYTFESVSQPSLCGMCWQQLSFITKPCCLNCGASLAFDGDACRSCFNKAFIFDSARAVLTYNDTGKIMITRFKHGGQTGYARLFAPWMRNIALNFFDDQDLVNESNWDAIVVVPLHPFRFIKRGFNQAMMLTQYMGIPLPVLVKALRRVRHTASQGHQSSDDRKNNMHRAFVAEESYVNGKRLLLIDDVMTTGATLNECAAALKNAGAIRVDVLVLARAIRA